MLPHMFDDAPEHTRNKVAGLYAILVAANIGVWLWAVQTGRAWPVWLLSPAVLWPCFALVQVDCGDRSAGR